MFDSEQVTGGEFLRRVRQAGRRNKVVCRWVPRHGVGSHGTLYFGDRLTVVQDLKRELPKGTLHAMLRQLGLSLDDIE